MRYLILADGIKIVKNDRQFTGISYLCIQIGKEYMKRFIACTLFFILLMWIGATSGSAGSCLLTPATETSEVVGADCTSGEKLSATVITGGWADISLQQSNALNGYNTCRRAGQSQLVVESIFVWFTDGYLSVPFFYKTFLYNFREYTARQRLAGYYIYALCKIII